MALADENNYALTSDDLSIDEGMSAAENPARRPDNICLLYTSDAADE